MTARTAYEFDSEAFLKALNTIPPHIVIEMAEDGIICDREISQLLIFMGIPQQQIDMLRQYFPTISRTIMRCASRCFNIQQEKGICRLTGLQAVQIMQELLNRGLISRYCQHIASAPSVAPLTPDLLFAKKKDARTRQ